MKSIVAFLSRGRVGLVGEDGRGERYIDFGRTDQKSWQLGPAFGDGRRFVAFSLEDTTMARLSSAYSIRQRHRGAGAPVLRSRSLVRPRSSSPDALFADPSA